MKYLISKLKNWFLSSLQYLNELSLGVYHYRKPHTRETVITTMWFVDELTELVGEYSEQLNHPEILAEFQLYISGENNFINTIRIMCTRRPLHEKIEHPVFTAFVSNNDVVCIDSNNNIYSFENMDIIPGELLKIIFDAWK